MSDLDGSTLRALAIPPDILDVDEDEMRRLGYWVVDRVIEHITTSRRATRHQRGRSRHAATRTRRTGPARPLSD